MPAVRYRSPDESTFLVFDRPRFRLDHGVFDLVLGPIRDRLAAEIEERAGWNLVAMKLVQEDRRLRACLEWLGTIEGPDDAVIVPGLVHEPALDLVAGPLIGDSAYVQVGCPACEAVYSPAEMALDPWAFAEEGVTVRGRRLLCPRGQTVFVMTDLIDDEGIEIDDR